MDESVASFYPPAIGQSPGYLDHAMSQDMLEGLLGVIEAIADRLRDLLPSESVSATQLKHALILGVLALEIKNILWHKATTTETFFGLKRSSKLPRSILLLSVIDSPLVLKLINQIIPGAAGHYTTLSTVYRLMFLLKLSNHFTPLSHALDIKLVRSPNAPSSVWFLWFMQLIQVFQSVKIPEILPNIPSKPPPFFGAEKFPGSVKVPVDSSLCSICHRPRINPTALRSGWVFCYRCLIEWQSKWGETKCPVTGRCVGPERRRIFN
jgi:hypothetical protein